MNVVVIDDEPVILSGISRMIPQIDPDWHIFGVFTDAAEALSNCDWDRVQVVLADITMPGMDGLSLVGALRENGFDTLAIFITAHANFAYAQRGAHLNMFDYLLKPVSRADLENVLRRAQQQSEKLKAGTENAEYIRENLHTLRKHFLGDLLFEERRITPEERELRLQEYSLVGVRYALALLRTPMARAVVKQALEKTLAAQDWMLYGQELCFEVLVPIRSESDVGRLEEALPSLEGQWAACRAPLPVDGLADAFRQLLPRALSPAQPADGRPEDVLKGKEVSAPVRLARQYIDAHYAEHLSLKSLADAVYLHPTYLSNVFKKQTGFAVVDYVNAVRVSHARRLLRDPRNRIYWIVEQVGFSNQRYFSHVFKALTGVTPMQYRQNALLTGCASAWPEGEAETEPAGEGAPEPSAAAEKGGRSQPG